MENARPDTKSRIMETAIQMFSAENYERVTMRDIAAAVGIKAASLYNHFNSKDEILTCIYELFEETAAGIKPPLAEIVGMADSAPPRAVVSYAFFYFQSVDQEKMLRILNIAHMMSRIDRRSREFFQYHVFDVLRLYTEEALKKLLALGRIEPLDIEDFLTLQAYFCYSAILRSLMPGARVEEEWEHGLSALLSLVKSTGK
ncbi:MAG: TetR/AcrR family transcriptional regulator [Gracilibacteraceae bacterium]|jgi:AcrR family transcriptional regulator|nr:TetR/AcrR family transcriptional regulator [Gracilibacteraceae bacterium]